MFSFVEKNILYKMLNKILDKIYINILTNISFPSCDITYFQEYFAFVIVALILKG